MNIKVNIGYLEQMRIATKWIKEFPYSSKKLAVKQINLKEEVKNE